MGFPFEKQYRMLVMNIAKLCKRCAITSLTLVSRRCRLKDRRMLA